MTETAANHIQMRPDTATMGQLADRAERMDMTASLQAKAEIVLWYAALGAELRRIRLTLGQATCIADVIGSADLKPAIATSVGSVYAQCYEAFRLAGDGISSFGAKHGISERELLDYLGSLGPAADHALADAFSRWWDQGFVSTADGFAMAGIRVSDAS